MNTDRFTELCAIVELLFAAHYTEREIVAYLMGPFGLSEDEALSAVRTTGRPLAFH